MEGSFAAVLMYLLVPSLIVSAIQRLLKWQKTQKSLKSDGGVVEEEK
jgi:hypothetical protein